MVRSRSSVPNFTPRVPHASSTLLPTVVTVTPSAISSSTSTTTVPSSSPRGSATALAAAAAAEVSYTAVPAAAAIASKPRLVKQKKSLCGIDDEEPDLRDLVKALPEFKGLPAGLTARKCASVFKQSSMNEELMSTERLREKERVSIAKETSNFTGVVFLVNLKFLWLK